MSPSRTLLLPLVLVAACGGPEPGGLSTTTIGITTALPGSASSTSSTGSSGSTGTPAGSSTSAAADSSTGPGSPDLPEFETLGPVKGCGKIDILFVINDAGTIASPTSKEVYTASAKLVRDGANGFITAMQEQAADYDLQVMVVKGDPAWPSTNGQQCCTEEKPCDVLGPYPCDLNQIEFTKCDSTLGSGVRYPTGFMGSNRDCALADGHRYITAAQDDFPTTFDCILNVGRSGAGQRPLAAMVQAVGPTLNGPGGCNAGFVRPDAMLVVVLLTRTEDLLSPGTPEGLAASLIAAKAGYADGIVVVGLLGSIPDADSDFCGDAPWHRTRLFVEGFPNHVAGSICAPDLGVKLSEAIGVIQTACERFTPPG